MNSVASEHGAQEAPGPSDARLPVRDPRTPLKASRTRKGPSGSWPGSWESPPKGVEKPSEIYGEFRSE